MVVTDLLIHITTSEDSVYGISIQNFGYSDYDYTPGSGSVTNNKVINNTIHGTGYRCICI